MEKRHEESSAQMAPAALTESVGLENLSADLAPLADTISDATIQALHHVPIIGITVGLGKGVVGIRKWLELRKIVSFLRELSKASPQKRTVFTERLKQKGHYQTFGENILLLLDRMDDMSKPSIAGKILAAHIDGYIEYLAAMRLAAMISRTYASDLVYLQDFRSGIQGSNATIAAMLCADGFLVMAGLDGGDYDVPESGGVLYEMSEYGNLLLKYGLSGKTEQ